MTARSEVRRRGRVSAVISLAMIGSLSLAACAGSRPTAGTAGSRAPSRSAPALATSLAGSDGTSWAVVEMGATVSPLNRFWELFVRPAGSFAWRLVTPTGVASNGGLVMTQGAAGTLVAGFRPSQDLTFSPLASSADAGAQWSPQAPLDPGLADVPGALAGNSAGRLLALTQTGDVESAADVGAKWTRLTSLPALAAGPAGRACGLTALTAVAWTPGGTPQVAGDCGKPGVTGIFTLSGGSWHAAAPRLTGPAASGATNVVGLTTMGGRTTAILTVVGGRAAFVVAAWSVDGGAHWAQSAALSSPVLAEGGQPSVSFAADGAAGLVVTPVATRGTASQVATIGWQARAWDTLPALPPLSGTTTSTRVATVVAAADGSEPVGSGVSPGQTVSPRGAAASGAPQALEVDGGTMTVWQLDTRGWTLAQTVRVPVPYGSSG